MANKEPGESKQKRTRNIKSFDKVRLRRANGLVDSAAVKLEQIRDILKREPEKAPLVIESLKTIDNQATEVLTALGY